jgi:hypothetical protein
VGKSKILEPPHRLLRLQPGKAAGHATHDGETLDGAIEGRRREAARGTHSAAAMVDAASKATPL